MGLYVSTTGGSVVISELGITIVHPTTDYALSDQFTAEEIQHAESLTTSIVNGTLIWKKTSGGSVETPSDYDPEFLDIEEESTGTGREKDRTATRDHLVDIYQAGTLKVEDALGVNFKGDSQVVDAGGGVAEVETFGAATSGLARYVISAGYQGSSSDVWLEFFNHIPSDQVPFVVPEDGHIRALSCAGYTWGSTNSIPFSIQVNGSEVTTITLTNPAVTNYVNGLNIALSAGDLIRIKAPRKGTYGDISYPLVHVFIQVLAT